MLGSRAARLREAARHPDEEIVGQEAETQHAAEGPDIAHRAHHHRERTGSRFPDSHQETSARESEHGLEQKAGVVPAAQLIGKGDESGMGEEDELPHARGPEEIGMEDMGPQHQAGSATERMTGNVGMQGIDVEAAVGRRIAPKPDPSTSLASVSTAKDDAKEEEEKVETPTTPKREAEEELTGEGKKAKVDTMDGVIPESDAGKTDIEIVDADGKTEDEPKVGEKGENKGGDAVDMSSV